MIFKDYSEIFKIHLIFLISLIITTYLMSLFGLLFITVIYLPISLVIFHIGHGVFIHRYFTHSRFNFSHRGIVIGHLFFIMTNMGKALTWAAMHVKHHANSGTSEDPHDWRNSSLLKGVFSEFGPSFGVDKRMLIKIRHRKYLSFFTKYHYFILLAYLPIFAPVILFSFFWKQFTTIIVHYDFKKTPGSQKRLGQDTSENLRFMKWLMWGDELHHDHHLNIYHNDFLNKIGKFWEKI